MRGRRKSKTVEIYHPTVARAGTGGRTITYGASADVSTRGQFIIRSTEFVMGPAGEQMRVDAVLFLESTVDIRPLAGSTYNEAPRDRVVVDSRNYFCLRAELHDALGGFIKAFLVRERE